MGFIANNSTLLILVELEKAKQDQTWLVLCWKPTRKSQICEQV